MVRNVRASSPWKQTRHTSANVRETQGKPCYVPLTQAERNRRLYNRGW